MGASLGDPGGFSGDGRGLWGGFGVRLSLEGQSLGDGCSGQSQGVLGRLRGRRGVRVISGFRCPWRVAGAGAGELSGRSGGLRVGGGSGTGCLGGELGDAGVGWSVWGSRGQAVLRGAVGLRDGGAGGDSGALTVRGAPSPVPHRTRTACSAQSATRAPRRTRTSSPPSPTSASWAASVSAPIPASVCPVPESLGPSPCPCVHPCVHVPVLFMSVCPSLHPHMFSCIRSCPLSMCPSLSVPVLLPILSTSPFLSPMPVPPWSPVTVFSLSLSPCPCPSVPCPSVPRCPCAPR